MYFCTVCVTFLVKISSVLTRLACLNKVFTYLPTSCLFAVVSLLNHLIGFSKIIILLGVRITPGRLQSLTQRLCLLSLVACWKWSPSCHCVLSYLPRVCDRRLEFVSFWLLSSRYSIWFSLALPGQRTRNSPRIAEKVSVLFLSVLGSRTRRNFCNPS